MNAECGFQSRFRSCRPVPLPISTPPRKNGLVIPRAFDACLQQLPMDRSSVYPAGSSGNALLRQFHFGRNSGINGHSFNGRRGRKSETTLNAVHTHLRVAQIFLHPIADVKNFRRRWCRWRWTRNGHQERLARRL
jgi:hypothetical protein